MKKFQFSLKTVHKFKNQVLDNLKNQYAAIQAAVVKQQEIVIQMEESYSEVNREFNRKNGEGITVLEATGYRQYLKTLEKKINDEIAKLEKLREAEAQKKNEMVEAKIEVASLDKLKDKRLAEYQKDVQKKEEVLIDEFVSNRLYAQ